MNNFIVRIWPYTKICTVLAIILLLTASFMEIGVYVLGIYLLSGWLLLPLVTYWMLGDHDWPISFVVKIYPRWVKVYVSYGTFFSLVFLSFFWVFLVYHAKSS